MAEVAELTAIIVEDESAARQLLRSMLDEQGQVAVVGECRTADEATAAVRELRPDLLFLDVEIPGGGFSVLEALEPDEMPAVIFTTAHSHYAVEAFKVRAIDYLLKPFDERRLEQAVDRMKQTSYNLVRQANAPILRFLEAWRTEQRYLNRLGVDSGSFTLMISTSEVMWLEANRRHTLVHTVGQTYTIREGLTELLTRLSPADFLRVHRSAAVRVDRITEIHRWFRGGYRLVLADGTKVTTGGRYKSEVERVLLGAKRLSS